MCGWWLERFVRADSGLDAQLANKWGEVMRLREIYKEMRREELQLDVALSAFGSDDLPEDYFENMCACSTEEPESCSLCQLLCKCKDRAMECQFCKKKE